jgi:hypothetical protein
MIPADNTKQEWLERPYLFYTLSLLATMCFTQKLQNEPPDGIGRLAWTLFLHGKVGVVPKTSIAGIANQRLHDFRVSIERKHDCALLGAIAVASDHR